MMLESKRVRRNRALAICAALSALLLMAAVAGCAYLYFTTDVKIVAFSAQATPARDQAAYFEGVRASLADGSFTGTAFQDDAAGTAEDYSFLTYTVRLQNNTFLPLDIVELRVVPREQDVCQIVYGNDAKTLSARATGDLSATILTRAGSHAIRELVVTYYVWGISFTVKETYG